MLSEQSWCHPFITHLRSTVPLNLPTPQVLFNILLLDFIPTCLFLPWKQSLHLVICLQLSQIIDMSNKYSDKFPFHTYALYCILRPINVYVSRILYSAQHVKFQCLQ
jgi:hypothetical protein